MMHATRHTSLPLFRTAMVLAAALVLLAPPLLSSEAKGGGGQGEVHIPLSVYQQLLDDIKPRRGAPVGYALSKAMAAVKVRQTDRSASADVSVQVKVEVFEDEWVLVPLLPAGTAVTRAAVEGRVIQLVTTPEGMSWVTKTAGTYLIDLVYRIDAAAWEAGFSMAVPLPGAPSSEMQVAIPGTDIEATVIPAVAVRTEETKGWTKVTATLPTTTAAQVNWTSPEGMGFVMSRARYAGELVEDAVVWTGLFEVELFSGKEVQIPLLPTSVTLAGLLVDGEEATVIVADGRFATRIEGTGAHQVAVRFHTPVVTGEGPPEVRLNLPQVPVSRFDLTLPGKKDISVRPAASLITSEEDGKTKATAYMPMTTSLAFSWVESIPADVRAEVQANASLYHLAHAEEGVLHVRAVVLYEITRGETNQFDLEIPTDTHIARILAPSGGLKDWRVVEGDDARTNRVSIFLDRAVKGEYLFEVHYERLFGSGPEAASRMEVPLLRAAGVHRQRGMVALLSGADLALNPVEVESVSKVGENQLPAFVRDRVQRTVAHTYKYFTDDPRLFVQAAVPERKAGKFNAQVDTLISLGEVAMKGSATIEVNVKSGSIMDLVVKLPRGVNVLGLTGPSIRTHQVVQEEAAQSVKVAFTQEMEGQFRLDLNYERIYSEGEAELAVPRISVEGAEVEHGRIAVEALTAVEVQATTTDHLSLIDINELPQQLVLKTTNPILLAYKYVYSEPPWRLTLKVTRHEELQVQEAVIERAGYKTLYTRDGLAVTTVEFLVRNSRKQFLRIRLPADSKVWSVFVAGKAEKPARATGEEEPLAGYGPSVLVKMITSTEGFPVQLVFETKVPAFTSLGQVEGRLPRPDMVVTHSRWDVFLPSGMSYQDPETNMDVQEKRRVVQISKTAAGSQFQQVLQQDAGQSFAPNVQRGRDQVRRLGPLHLVVPESGVHFAFEKLYANLAPQGAYFTVRYASVPGQRLALFLSILGAVLIWWGLLGTFSRAFGIGRALAGAVMALGAVLLVVSLWTFRAGAEPVLLTSGVMIVLAGLRLSWVRLMRHRQGKKAGAPEDQA